jgi:hypothetical protein
MSRRERRALEKQLRLAQPRLFTRTVSTGWEEGVAVTVGFDSYIREVDPGWDEVLSEGFDPDGSPLGPVFWRIVDRGAERLYCSTFLVRREQIIPVWGTNALSYCDHKTGTAVARIETLLATDEGNAPSSQTGH